jgi:hypothetical protein
MDDEEVKVLIGIHQVLPNPASQPEYNLDEDDIEYYNMRAETALGGVPWELIGNEWFAAYHEEIIIPITHTDYGGIYLNKTAALIIEAAKRDRDNMCDALNLGINHKELFGDIYDDIKRIQS